MDRFTLSVEAGETFGLLGPNGAGKTTVIRMLTTLLPLTSGSARIAGYDVVHRATDVRRSIGYVSQILSADGSLTGCENLLVFARLYDLPRDQIRARVEEALQIMGLSIYGLPLDLGVLGAFAVALVLIGGHYYAKLVL